MSRLQGVSSGGLARARRYRKAMVQEDTVDLMRVGEQLFGTLQMLPSQLESRERDAVMRRPEFQLWAAAAIMAVCDYLETKPTHRRYQLDAERWFGSNSEQPGSFVWVCGLFTLDPDAARDGLKQVRDALCAEQLKLARHMAMRN